MRGPPAEPNSLFPKEDLMKQVASTYLSRIAAAPNLRSDLLASLVVFLVAVPLGLGIALASGAPIVSGLIACAVGGIVAGLLGGAPLQVSGPAAGLTVIVYGIIQQHGWQATLLITVAAGALQLLFGSLKIARTCLAISPAVVHGMLAGIGIVIALAQLHIVLGGKPDSSALHNLRDLPAQIMDHHSHAAILGLLTFGIMVAWQYVPQKLRLVPGALVAVLTATLISTFSWFDVARVDLPEKLFTFATPTLPKDWAGFGLAALSVALVASVESLLCAVATDKLHNNARADLDRELKAQGVANMTSGLLGGVPVTGVIVRSAANITAGAQTRLSSVLHGVWILGFTVLLAGMIERIPLAALAGLLVFVGVKLVNMNHIRQLRSHGEIIVYAATVLGVTFINLLAGVGLGIGVAIVLLLRRLAVTRIRVEQQNGRWHVHVEGSLTFLAVPKLTAALSTIPQGVHVDVDIATDFLDHGAFEALHDWRIAHERQGGTVDIDEAHEDWYEQAKGGSPRASTGKSLSGAPLQQLAVQGANRDVPELLKGFVRFRRFASQAMTPLFKRLAIEGQRPNVLLICCADSRLVPHYITASSPGDLFKVRNIGNLVPCCASHGQPKDTSVAAAIEYGLHVLKLRNIVICGHSRCGAMKALLESPPGDQLPNAVEWLRHGGDSRERFVSIPGYQDLPIDQQADELSKINVLVQLEHLQQYPAVQQALAADQLKLHAWYFDIEHTQLYVYSTEREAYVPVEKSTLGWLNDQPAHVQHWPGGGLSPLPA
jgi:carbonic anhydrase